MSKKSNNEFNYFCFSNLRWLSRGVECNAGTSYTASNECHLCDYYCGAMMAGALTESPMFN